MAVHINDRDKELASEIEARMGALKSQRALYERAWRDAVQFVAPDMHDFTSQNVAGSQQNYIELLDGTAGRAAETLATTLHSHLTNTSHKWFGLKPDRQFKDDDEVAAWLTELRDILFEEVFMNPESKFGTAMHEFYLNFCILGTGILFVDRSKKKMLFRSVPLQQCYIMENSDGIVDTVYRSFKRPAKDILAEYEDKLPAEVIAKMKKERMEEWSIIHAVEPRTVFDSTKRDNKNMPYRSVYFLEKDSIILEESGYRDLPYIVARYSKRSGEQYGRSPVQKAMPDIRMINSMKESNIKAAQLATLPPLQAMGDEFAGRKIKIKPAAIVPTRTKEPLTPIYPNLKPHIAQDMIRDTGEDVQSTLGSWAFGENKKKNMTATEILDNQEKALYELSAVVQRLEEECYKPLVDLAVVFVGELHNDQTSNFYLPLPPTAAVFGTDYKVHYVSPVVRAVRASEAMQTRRYLDLLFGQNANPPEELLRSINWRGFAKSLHKALDLDPEIIIGDAEYESMMQDSAAAVETMNELENLKTLAAAGKDGAGAVNQLQAAA